MRNVCKKVAIGLMLCLMVLTATISGAEDTGEQMVQTPLKELIELHEAYKAAIRAGRQAEAYGDKMAKKYEAERVNHSCS